MAKLNSEQAEEIRGLAKESLYFLCQQFLGYKDWDKVHDDVEKFLRKPARKKALMLPRGHLKTSFVTIGYTIQQLIKNPNTRILIGNGVWDIARSFLSEIKAQLEGSQLKYLFGDFQSARWNADEIIVKQRTKPLKEPTVMTTGVEAETTGGHYDIIILDDLIGLQNSQTPEQRAKVKRFRRSMINLLEPGGLLIEIGTRWHLDDTFSEIFEKEMKYYNVMVKKVYEPGADGKQHLIFPKHFAKKFDDIRKDWSVVPDDTCMDYVDHLKASMPLDEFSAQYLNEPFSSENQLFKPEMFKYWNQRPIGLYTAMTVDLAISQAREADSTAIVVAGMDKDYNLYVLDYLKGQWKPSQVVENVFKMRDKWKPYSVGMETNGFQRTLKLACEEEMRRSKNYFSIDEIKTGPERSKETRIKSLEPFYRNGNVFHASWMKGKDLENELQTFPKGKHDDLCFVAGTKIATNFGDKNIEEIKIGDEVITPFGLRKVLTSGKTGEYKTIKQDGLEGTHGHPVFTYNSGFVTMDALTMVMLKSKFSLKELLLWKYRRLLNSMEENSKEWGGRDAIISASLIQIKDGEVRRDFMWRFGNFIQKRQFQKVSTFTIKTAIHLITTLKIWSAYRLGNIIGYLKILMSKNVENFLKGSGRLQKLGTLPGKVVNGIEKIPWNIGKIQRSLIFFASNVRKVLIPLNPIQSFAVNHIAQKNIEQCLVVTTREDHALYVGMNLFRMDGIKKEYPKPAQDHVEENLEKEVYNLTVDQDHVYFANGILVSNCDSLSMSLPFLSPGVSTPTNNEDDWDRAIKQAQQFQRRNEGFFNYEK